MIFQSIHNIKDKTSKDFFKEKIGIYIRLIQCYAEKYSFKIPEANYTSRVAKELISIGIIDKEADIKLLKKLISEINNKILINCVSFALDHPETEPLLVKIKNSSRKGIQSLTNNNPTVVDFFCGAGGLSLGFIQAGFKVILANDIQDVCCETYKYNHPELPSNRVVQGDIKELIDNVGEIGPVDMVIGGPPCQGFSSANQQKVIDDPRNKLYKYFIEAVTKFSPKVVVMENVKGMLKVADQVIKDYSAIRVTVNGEKVHYVASCRLLNSANFGVAQNRERLIYIAIRSDIAEKKAITPDIIYSQITEMCATNSTHNLREALEYIKPLKSPRVKGLTNIDDELTGKKIDYNIFDGSENEYLRIINQNRHIPYLFNHKARYASDVNYHIFERLNQGDDATDEKIMDIMPYARRNHCFKDKYYKLVADKPCRTITAHLRMDCLSHIHPFQVRTITPREAARVQSFPDDYLFLGAYLKTYMEIGNAVPPLMARQIASVIKKYIN